MLSKDRLRSFTALLLYCSEYAADLRRSTSVQVGDVRVVTRTDYDNQLHRDWTERNVRSETHQPLATDLDKSDEIALGGAPGHRRGHNSDTIVPVVPQCKGSFEWRSKEPSS